MKEISTNKLKNLINLNSNINIIDVRKKEDFKMGHIKGSKNVPLDSIEDYSDFINNDEVTYFVCTRGNSSSHAILLLNELGLTNLVNVRGGMLSWDGEIEKF